MSIGRFAGTLAALALFLACSSCAKRDSNPKDDNVSMPTGKPEPGKPEPGKPEPGKPEPVAVGVY